MIVTICILFCYTVNKFKTCIAILLRQKDFLPIRLILYHPEEHFVVANLVNLHQQTFTVKNSFTLIIIT